MLRSKPEYCEVLAFRRRIDSGRQQSEVNQAKTHREPRHFVHGRELLDRIVVKNAAPIYIAEQHGFRHQKLCCESVRVNLMPINTSSLPWLVF